MPVYQLLGGKCREAADCYGHASGGEISEVIESAKRYMAMGFRHVRCQIGVPGMAGYGAGADSKKVPALHDGRVYEPAVYIRRVIINIKQTGLATYRLPALNLLRQFILLNIEYNT